MAWEDEEEKKEEEEEDKSADQMDVLAVKTRIEGGRGLGNGW